MLGLGVLARSHNVQRTVSARSDLLNCLGRFGRTVEVLLTLRDRLYVRGRFRGDLGLGKLLAHESLQVLLVLHGAGDGPRGGATSLREHFGDTRVDLRERSLKLAVSLPLLSFRGLVLHARRRQWQHLEVLLIERQHLLLLLSRMFYLWRRQVHGFEELIVVHEVVSLRNEETYHIVHLPSLL